MNFFMYDGTLYTLYMSEEQPLPRYKRVTISLHPIDIKRLDYLAKHLNITRSGLVAHLAWMASPKKQEPFSPPHKPKELDASNISDPDVLTA